MEMVQYQRAKARKPEDLAKVALRSAAAECLKGAEWPSEVLVTVEIGETVYTLEAKPTASLRDGRIMYHFGHRDEFKGLELTFGGNILLPTAVPTHGDILKRYGVTVKGSSVEPTEAELSAAEFTR